MATPTEAPAGRRSPSGSAGSGTQARAGGLGARLSGSAGGGGRRGTGAGWILGHPLLGGWALALLLAIVSALAWPTVPSYDPFSWIVWGREVSDPSIAFFIGNGPSWKPLPFFFTTIYGTLGGIAPTLWVITARTGGIAGLLGIWRLCAILCRRAGLPTWAGVVAGAAGIVGIVLTDPQSPWTYYFFRGTSETLLIGVWVWAIERMLAGRHLQAYILIALEGLMRPEAWPFLVVYGAWLWWRREDGSYPALGEGVRSLWRPGVTRVIVALGVIAQPVGWFVPPWISTGSPFMAAIHAHDYNGDLGSDVLKTILQRGEQIQSLPSLGFAVVGVLLCLWLGRRRLPWRGGVGAVRTWWRADTSELPLVLGLAVAAIGWWIVVIVETEKGYPGLERFYLPAAAMICVLSGYGLVRVAIWLGSLAGGVLGGVVRWGGDGGRFGRSRIALGTAVVASAVFLGGSTHFLGTRWAYAKEQEPRAAVAVTRIRELGTSIRVLGGRSAMLPCTSSVVTINHALQTALAWKLGTDLARVQTTMTKPGIAFVGPRDTVDGGVPFIAYHFQTRTLATVGAWVLQQVWPAGEPRPRCVGR